MTADQRQSAILDASERLLTTHGWETVTINDILSAAGISRGGFYHHFSSKDDILSAMVLRFVDAATASARTGRTSAPKGSIAYLSAFLSGTIQWELDHLDEVLGILRLARRPGNQLLFMEMGDETARRTLPVLTDLLEQGVEQGAFTLADPDLTAQLLLRLARTRLLAFVEIQDLARANEVQQAAERLHTRLRAERQATERLLDVPQGSIVYPPDSAFDGLLR